MKTIKKLFFILMSCTLVFSGFPSPVMAEEKTPLQAELFFENADGGPIAEASVRYDVEDKKSDRFVEITDTVTGKAIPNASVLITSADGKEVFRGKTNDDGWVNLPELAAGKYTCSITELPKGYTSTEPFTFEVVEGNASIALSLSVLPSDGASDTDSEQGSVQEEESDSLSPVQELKEILSGINTEKLTSSELEQVYSILEKYNALSEEERAELSDEENEKILELAGWYLKTATQDDSSSSSSSDKTVADASSPKTGIVEDLLFVVPAATLMVSGVCMLLLRKKKKKITS